MADLAVYLDVFDQNTDPLEGLDLSAAFTAPGFYMINDVPAAPPAIAPVAGAAGRYKFTASLVPGDRLSWRADMGLTALSRFEYGSAAYADCVTPPDASAYTDERAVKLDLLDVAVSTRQASVGNDPAPAPPVGSAEVV